MKTTPPDQVQPAATWEVRQIRPIKRNPWPRLTAVLAVSLALLLSYTVSAHVPRMLAGVADLLDLNRAGVHPGDRNGLNPR